MKRRTYLKRILAFGLFSYLFVVLYRLTGGGGKGEPVSLEDKRKLIDELVETIIPATDSPGAREAQVSGFIISMIRDCSSAKQQRSFVRGLEKLDQYAVDRFGRPFVSCSEADRITILTDFENKAVFDIAILNKVYQKLFGEPFITKLKNLTIEGYCTSKLGATEGLRYDPVPVYYHACILAEPGQRSWATK